MRTYWLTAIAALALAYLAGPAGAQELLDPEPDEPVYTVVAHGRHGEPDPDLGPPIKPWSFTIASGIYLLQPSFQSDPALVVTRAGIPQTEQLDFKRHMVAAPAVWLGVTSDRGYGARLRWFTLDQSVGLDYASRPGEQLSAASPVAAAQTPAFGTATASGELHLDSWEAEATCQLDRGKWCLLLGAGVRYVHLDQVYASTVVDNAGALTTAASHHNFNGAGPTFSCQGKCGLGHTCFGLYGNLTTSVLFGSAEDAYAGQAPNGTAGNFSRHQVSVLPIGELEVGAEYSKPLHHARFFVQTGFVGQVWWGAGSASNFDALNGAASSYSNFGFVGLAFRAGLAF